MKKELLWLDRITMYRENVRLLDSLSMHLFVGEILGLIPINAQGLEELLDLIKYNGPIHYGYVWFFERVVNDYRWKRSTANPVAVIEKRSRLIGSMSVTDNIFVVRGCMKKYLINDGVLSDQLERLCEGLNISIPPHEPVERLPFFTRWLVELLKAVVAGARLIIIRDISNVASPVDLSRIHRVIRYYASLGLSFLYVCNHHEEVFPLCNRTVLMEDGKILKTLRADQMNNDLMRRFPQGFVHFIDNDSLQKATEKRRAEKPVLEVRNLCRETIKDLSLSLFAGECLILLDLDNSLLPPVLALWRDRKAPEKGSIRVAGRPFQKARRLFAFIDEKPTHSNLFADMSYLDNLCFLADDRLPFFWTKRRYLRSIRREYLPLIGPVIDAPSLAGLSLHDLYELVYHRILLQKPRLVFCVQPFAGIDMYQRLRIIQLLDLLRQRGIAVLILAVSLSDSLQVADRLLVVKNGRAVREIARQTFSSLDSVHISKE
jgi:ribose transport system ATP-binding protein